MAMTGREASAACAAELRRLDYDRYLTALFARRPGRARLIALYAFNQEIARTAEMVSEPTLGAIRLQWWREAIEDAYQGRIRDHPVPQALAHAGALAVLSRDTLHALIDARARDLDAAPFADRTALEAYAAATSSRLIELALQALGVTGAGEAARRGGIAWALLGLMRAIPHLARQGRCPLPEALLAAHGTEPGAVLDGRVTESVRSAVREVAGWAGEHLAAARENRIARAALPALLPLALARLYLCRLERACFDPFAPTLVPSPLARQAALLQSHLRGRP